MAVPEEITHPDLIKRYHQLMNKEEAQRQRRFHFHQHRHQFLITRALVRCVLSYYYPIAPAAWQFKQNRYGKPGILPKEGMPPLKFNLSHTDGLVLCGVTLNRKIGVDIENPGRNAQALDIAERFFSPREVKDLLALPEQQRHGRFFDYWTLKESYIKVCGLGLAIPLDHFSMHIDQDQALSISFDSKRQDDPNLLNFWSFTATEKIQGALCVRNTDKNKEHQTHLKFFKTVPLHSYHSLTCKINKQSS